MKKFEKITTTIKIILGLIPPIWAVIRIVAEIYEEYRKRTPTTANTPPEWAVTITNWLLGHDQWLLIAFLLLTIFALSARVLKTKKMILENADGMNVGGMLDILEGSFT